MQPSNFHTAGLYMFELIPFEGNELVCRLTTYRWNGDGWSFKSLEAVYFKDITAKEAYIKTLLRRYQNEI